MWNNIAKKREAEGQWEELKLGNYTTDSQTFSMENCVVQYLIFKLIYHIKMFE